MEASTDFIRFLRTVLDNLLLLRLRHYLELHIMEYKFSQIFIFCNGMPYAPQLSQPLRVRSLHPKVTHILLAPNGH